VASRDRSFVIPFVGLKPGKHEFDFEIGDEFFESYEYAVIQYAKIQGKLILEKKETMLIGEFFIEGTVETTCDRCGGEMELPIKGEFRLIFKFEDEDSEDENLVSIGSDAYELETADHFYELITISLPSRSLHPEGECDPEVIEKLEEHSVEVEDEDNDDIDPRWAALKGLNKN
jgi:uncharacterized protein